LPEDVRDNSVPADLPGGYYAYNLYEAETLLPKPSEKMKKVTDSNTFTLNQDFSHIANIDGEHYGITDGYEDPDTGEASYAYQKLSDQNSPVIETYIEVKPKNTSELINFIRENEKAPKISKVSKNKLVKKQKAEKKVTYAANAKAQKRIADMRSGESKALYDRALPRVAKLVSDRMEKLGLGKYIKTNLEQEIITKQQETPGVFHPLKKLIELAVSGKSDKQIMSTLNHESIHAMVQLGMITGEELNSLKKLVDSKGWIKTFRIVDRYPELANKLNDQYEEAIADAFATYVTGRSPLLYRDSETNTPVYAYKKDLKIAGQPVGIINRILKILKLVKDVAAEDAVFKRFESPVAPKEVEAKGATQKFSAAPTIVKNIVKNNEGYWIYTGKLPESFYKWFGNSVAIDKDGYPKIKFHGTARDITEFKPDTANAIFTTDDEKFAEDFSRKSRSEMMDKIDQFVTPERQNELRAKAKKSTDNERKEDDEFYRLLKNELPSEENIIPLFVRVENPFDYTNKDHLGIVKKALEVGKKSPIDKATTQLVLAKISKGSWKEIQRKDVQKAIKDAGFDGFYEKEMGYINLAVYDPNQVKSVTGNSGEYSRESKDIRKSVAPKLAKDINSAYASNTEVNAVRSILPIHPDWVDHIDEKFSWDDKDTGDYKNDRKVLERGKKKLVIGRITPQDWIDRVELMLQPRERVDSRNWYKNIKSEFQGMFGNEWPKYMVAYLLGNKAESPRGALNNTLYVAEEIKTMTSSS